jgi:phosphopantothenoylcysteine synthetase/decarboxylase
MSMEQRRRAIVTCGPSYEPIDRVRRITNFSTGKLGVMLSNRLARAGWRVMCLKGVMATHPEPLAEGVEWIPFSTNDDLLERLRAVPARHGVTAVFHAAALADFKVKEVRGAEGSLVEAAKIPSRAGELTIVLEPGTKLLPELRTLFRSAQIVGWKYELVGTREDALEKGRRQMAENGTDLCVVNGSAYGHGFGALAPDGSLAELESYEALCAWLAAWAVDVETP